MILAAEHFDYGIANFDLGALAVLILVVIFYLVTNLLNR